MEETIRVFVQPPNPDFTPEEEAMCKLLLPALRHFVLDNALQGMPIGAWEPKTIKRMICLIGTHWHRIAVEAAENPDDTDSDKLPIEAGKLLQAG